MDLPARENLPKLPSELNRIRILTRGWALRKYFRNHVEPKLHLGSGPNYKEGWLNADKFDSRADIYLNLHATLPFAEESFQYIYSEHTLEHIKITRVKKLLSECYRILKTGGSMRLSIPDLELFARKYIERDQDFLEIYLDLYRDPIEKGDARYWMVRSLGGVFNTLATRHFFHHRWFYDFETLQLCCSELGFKFIIQQEYRRTNHAAFKDMDRPIRKHESLYLELTK